MTDKQIGKLIREIRKEKNITIDGLAYGLCDDSTLSCFEKGKRKLDNLLLHRIFDRIGIEADEFAVMVDEEQYEYHMWKEQTVEAVEKQEWDVLEALLTNKEIAIHQKYNKKIQYQYYYKLKGIWQVEKNHNYKQAVAYLIEAMEQTMPDILTIEWEKLCLGEQELHILMLYLYYGAKGQCLQEEEQKALYDKLEDYISETHMESKKLAKLYPKLVCIWLNIAEVGLPMQKVLCEKAIRILQEIRRLHDITELLRLYVEVLEERQDEQLVFYRKHLENFSDIFQDAGMQTGFQPEILAGRREKLFLITEYLRSTRLAKNMTQEETCASICEPSTYSRIETGKHIPVKTSMYELTERLGIPWCYYRGELELDSLKAYRIYQEVKKMSNRGHWEECLYMVEKLKKLLDKKNRVNVQYVKFEQMIAERGLGMINAGQAYGKYQELLEMTTVLPMEEQFRYYSQTELEIIGYMGKMLYIQKQYDEGISLLEKVLINQKKSKVDWNYQWHGIDFVLQILADLYFGAEKYEEANRIEIFVMRMNLGRLEAISLPHRLDGIADNYEHMGEQYSETYKKLYRQTYYVADFYMFEDIILFAKKYYEDSFDKNMEWY